jgi:hypothetical protein
MRSSSPAEISTVFRTAIRGGFLSSFSVPNGGMRMRVALIAPEHERRGVETVAKTEPQ